MSYNDFWFVDTRVQTVNLRRYLFWAVLIFTFVSIGTYFAIKNMYNDIKVYDIQTNGLQINVSEAKATNVNGYVKGDITNNSEQEIKGKYLCFLLFNDTNELEGVEYIEVKSISPSQKENFEMKYRKSNVTEIYILFTDNMQEFENKV